MGNLFPDDPEYPDHRPIPSPAVEAVKPTVTSLALTASLGALCPVPPRREIAIHEHEHVPHHDLVEIRPAVAFGVGGSPSSSGDPMTWQNGSVNDAAMIAIRRHHALRAAHARIAASMSMGSPAVLLSTDASMTLLPTYPAMAGNPTSSTRVEATPLRR